MEDISYEEVRDNISSAIKNAAYDYYLSYMKDDMPTFIEASKLIGIATYTFLKTVPDLLQYINYCKVTALHEILPVVCERDYKLEEPAPVTMVEIEMAAANPTEMTDGVKELMAEIILPLCETYYGSYINDDGSTFQISSQMLEGLPRIAAHDHPHINDYINYCKVEAANHILNETMPREYVLFNHPYIMYSLINEYDVEVLKRTDDVMPDEDKKIFNRILSVMIDLQISSEFNDNDDFNDQDLSYIFYQLLKNDDLHELLEMTDNDLKEKIIAIIG